MNDRHSNGFGFVFLCVKWLKATINPKVDDKTQKKPLQHVSHISLSSTVHCTLYIAYDEFSISEITPNEN